MAKDILKEAIADAKAVREVALANAKAALEEAFTPRLQSMLSAKLSEEINEEEDLDETYMEDEKEDVKETYMEDEADEDMKEAYMEDEKDKVDEMYDEDEKDSMDEEIDLEEILSELELEEAKDEDKDMKKEGKDEADEDMKEGKEKEELDEMGRPIYKAEDANYAGYTADRIAEDKDFDLDALLEEINNLEEKEDKDEVDEGMFDRGGSREKYRDRYDDDAAIDDYNRRFEEGEEINEVDPLTIAGGIGGLIAAAGGLTALEMAADDPEFKAKYPRVARALEKLQDIGKAAGQQLRRETKEKDEELKETKAALEAVKSELNEVNLLNSKLLYVNRIFKSNNLSEAQKLRVVETLDNATNIKEAKLIYGTIKDTFVISKGKKTTPKKSIREGLGMASKAAGTSTAPKKPVLNESTDMVTRMQKLANIKINQ